MTLDKLEPGRKAVIRSVGGTEAMRCRLLDMGFTPGTEIVLMAKAPMGDPAVYLLRGYELSIRLEDAAEIGIEGAE